MILRKNKGNKTNTDSKTGLFTHFFQFFTVFSGIFIVMTVIILQVMRYGIYSSIDNTLKEIVPDANQYADMIMSRNELSNDEKPSGFHIKFRPNNRASANTTFLVYDSSGQLLSNNNYDTFLSSDNTSINTKTLNQIEDEELTNIYGQNERYHSITIKATSTTYSKVAYIKAVMNVEQLDQAKTRYEKIVIIVMSIFWIVSIIASVYLANWTRKPIVESFARQKAFVENASHELRTPLAVLQNRLETLFRKPMTTVLDNSEIIASSLDEVRNMKILTTNLLDLARRDDGINPTFETIYPEEIDKVFENYEMIAVENEKTFIYHNNLSSPFTSDRALLKQVMTILFDNAVKYTGEDGIIEFTINQTDKQIFIKVADNGLGIKDSDKKKIFDRFYRVDKARTRQSGGFGLGLSLAQQIIKTLKGSIKVSDNKPKGTIFEIKL